MSNDYCIMASAKDPLKKELEEELKLNTDDLRSHAWYHGPIPRQEAEALLERDGDFLIRGSRSSPGNYVLTCSWKDAPLHFKIIRIVLRPRETYSRVLYQFEQESFDNVPALVRFYVGNRRPISKITGAVVFHPLNRTLPLRCIEEKHGIGVNTESLHQPPSGKDSNQTKRFSLDLSDEVSLDQVDADSNLLRNQYKSGSQPNILDDVNNKRILHSAQSDSYLSGRPKKRVQASGAERAILPKSPVYRTGSDSMISPKGSFKHLDPRRTSGLRGSDGQLHSKAPPKPQRAPSDTSRHPGLQPASEPDLGIYSELVPQVPHSSQDSSLGDSHVGRLCAQERANVRARMTTDIHFLDSEEPLSLELTPERGAEEEGFTRPHVETGTAFKLDTFNSILLPHDNKALEPSVLKRLKEIFAEHDPETTARHILKVDCQVARITEVSPEERRMMGVNSGLELITLSHGHQLRMDLLERHSLIALGIAVDILGCTGSVGQRASVLHKIIQLAIELKDTMGDLYGFSAVMKALELPQITRLEFTWRTLRRTHTDSAIAFEKKLKPFMKSMNEGNAGDLSLQNISVPHILPIIMLMERQSVFDLEGWEGWENMEQGCEILLKTLEAARATTLNTDVFRVNTEARLKDMQINRELLEAFRTEFALRLFWGPKAAELGRGERYEKFDKILTALSRKLEPESPLEI
ncbi:breast cancer anti-estrogen resistance protein 3 homolog isoform X1 [Callorhinchus milii]|uniref:breast cancer anti-estrogen resistance protein 3 homolog isoform X1 n=1 Tax=Callorhinchus milii TaxID=7868 RepID=UPI0004573459|nr:breast cancer anti-estrogen resistance protein 3 homolog isoform X1 [Callorhinchus milii]XP_007905331.1 breast cancer anti-estrogen resistance protein 3 homolog isoform X1 [Callorhinchus milii]|eukprot:gi/632977412/ref/XP_007905329.1/ PREDICTED: SH2 domain-containing protein 3A isoform X1 [Callorhinchus milii]